METITQNPPKLKYKIKLKLAELTDTQRVVLKKKVLNKTGISAPTYSRYINCRENDKTDIPGTVLATFADLLHTTIDELIYSK